MENGNEKLLMYDLGEGVEAFSTRKNSVLPYHVIQPHQTHSTNVAVIDRPDYTKEELEGIDALVTNLPGVAIGVRTADCIPVLLYDPVHKAVGAAHSGDVLRPCFPRHGDQFSGRRRCGKAFQGFRFSGGENLVVPRSTCRGKHGRRTSHRFVAGVQNYPGRVRFG